MHTSEDLFLPEPVPREVKYTIISVDDHVVEPRHLFEGRLPAGLRDRAPRVVETPEGHQVWKFEGKTFTQVGMNAVAGRRPETVDTVNYEPFRFEQMRPGCYDVDARVKDMDINGVWASVNFPSMITGFCGSVFFGADDPELGAACTRAWNDWLYEEWYLSHPTRIVPHRRRVPRRLAGGRGGDPPQRRARLHRREHAGASGAHRSPGSLGP